MIAQPHDQAPNRQGARVLVVDDEHAVRRVVARILCADGWTVTMAENAEEALALVRENRFDVIISDVSMPGMDGLSLLREIRAIDLDVPVLLLTGEPTLDRATAALEYGAFRFFSKPVEPPQLTQAVGSAFAVGRTARIRREALPHVGEQLLGGGDLAGVEAHFNKALSSLWVAFQPIVSLSRRRVVAFEALMRSREASLPHPGAILDAAQRLNRMLELGRHVRTRTAQAFVDCPDDARLFVNLHTVDLDDELLFSADSPLRALAPRCTLEITERAALPPLDVLLPKLNRLRDLGYQIALDDLGAGYSGLSSFAWLEPEVVKLDMSIVRDIHTSDVRQKLARAMLDLCRDLGKTLVAEGVEAAEERDVLASLGCDLFQGYYFARPGPPFPQVMFDA